MADYWETCDPDFRDGTGAETFREFVERVETTMSKLTSLPLQNSVVFCHGQYMQMVRWRQAAPAKLLDGEAMREFRLLDLQNPIQHCEQVRIRGF